MTTDQPDLARILPDYELGQELGRGQFGVVLAARHRQLGRPVAIKQLMGPVAANPEYRARFRREARMLAHLDHRHVVTVYDYREDASQWLLVMELLTGGTLADRHLGGTGIEAAVAATLAAASGLSHVHTKGILHRDVKPENLMFDAHGVLKVTDFGIARGDAVTATAVHLTQAGQFFGTPAYAAPEQAAEALGGGWPPVGPATDQYSLAAVLYEAVSGQLTHDASGGFLGLCTRRMNEEARSLAAVAPSVPGAIDTVVMRALSRDPAMRYPTTEDFGVELALAANGALGHDWLTRSDVKLREPGPISDAAQRAHARPVTPTPPPADHPTPPDPPTPPAAPSSAPRRARSWALAGAAVGAVGLVAIVLVMLTGGGGQGDATATDPGSVGDLPLEVQERWSFLADDVIFGSPSIAGDLVVAASDDGSAFGLDAADGSERWRFQTEDTVRAAPTVVGDRVYVASNDGRLYALDLRSQGADEAWRVVIGHQMAAAPVVADDTVLVAADHLYALAVDDGSERWRFDGTTDVIVATPAVHDDTVIVAGTDGRVHGVDLADGEQRWRFATAAPVVASPVVVGGTAYVFDQDGVLYAIGADDGEPTWQLDVGSPIRSSPVSDGEHLYVGTAAGTLVAIELDQQQVVWSFEAGDRIDSSPTLVEDMVVVGSNDNRVYFVDRAGDLQGVFETEGPVVSSPDADDDFVAIGSHDRRVYALEWTGSPNDG